jgi:Zn-finger nucleic acid-binding protein
MTERQGIEIDYCPRCRGVWLDRGELDKLIERSQTAPTQRAYETQAPLRRDYDDDEYYGDPRKRRKRGGFLGELFDFD